MNPGFKPSTSLNQTKPIGIALATSTGAQEVTTEISKALTAKGFTNIVVSLVAEPSILPFVTKSLCETCQVVIAVAVLNAESGDMSQFLTKALTETGAKSGCPVVPGTMSPSSLLELKAMLPACATQWANSVSAIVSLQNGAKPVSVTTLVSAEILAAAAAVPVPVTEKVEDVEHLLSDLRESFKVTYFVSIPPHDSHNLHCLY